MKKIRSSASQVSKFRRCRRAFAFEYVEGLRPPPSTKQEFGLEMHSELEQWLKQNKPPSDSPAGETARQGIEKGWLPIPSDHLLVEKKFVFEWVPGVEMIGYIDCVDPPRQFDTDYPIVIDHKSTSDLRWAMSFSQLASDPQAIIYSVWAMLEYEKPQVRARWIYYAASNPRNGPRKPRGAKPVEVLFDSRDLDFQAKVSSISSDLIEIAQIRREEIKGLELPPSPESCEVFGGCFHKSICSLSTEDKIEGYMKKVCE